MNSGLFSLCCGLGCAFVWGAGDFSGGQAAKKCNSFLVVFYSQLLGILVLIPPGIIYGLQAPSWGQAIGAAAGGSFGALGLAALYKGLSLGKMGITAPVSAVVGALIPIVFSSIFEGTPKVIQYFGLAAAIMAIWLITYERDQNGVRAIDLKYPVIAGLGFGLYFTTIDQFCDSGIIWPLFASRTGAIVTLAAILSLRGELKIPGSSSWFPISMAGLLDAVGSLFFALAAVYGRLDIAAALASLYPITTVLLAWLVLKENMHKRQWAGVMAAISSLVLVAM